MTPGEVSGLQSLAMAHGGSLTINPTTGLPEAGILSSLLPTLIGFGLAPLTGGLSAALITGAGYTAATGSLKKGIMAGLGAYGGAGLAGGLNAMGAQSAAAGTVDDIALASKNAAANSQIGAGYNTIAPQTQVFGQPAVSATSAATTTAPNMGFSAYTSPKPLYPDVNFASGMQTPTAVTSSVPTGTDRFVRLGDPMNYPAPNQTVSQRIAAGKTNAFSSPIDQGSQYYKDISGKIKTLEPRSELAQKLTYDGAKTYPDLSTLEYGGGYGTAPGGRYFIENPLKGSAASSTGAPIVNRSGMQTVLEKPVVRSEILPGDPALAQPQSITGPYRGYMSQVGQGAKNVYAGGMQGLKDLYAASEAAAPYSGLAGLGSTAYSYYDEKREEAEEEMRRQADKSPGMIRPYEFSYSPTSTAFEPYSGSAERTYFQPSYTALTPYEAPGPEYAAKGGLMGLAVGGPIEQMAAMNAVGANTGYPMASINTPVYSNPMMQRPEATNVVAPSADAGVGAYSGEMRFAVGGVSTLGDYSDGGRLLKGPGDGVSDSIPASIGNRQPARLADGEFVVPARIVSEIGNGSTEAGARKLYAMMDRVQKARRKTVGKNQVARNTKAEKLLPA
jgi:hypothetical protein